MDVRTTAFSPGPQSQGSDPFLIDRGALRSILSNLSHELCRPLISLRTGFDLLLGESPSAITSDQRGHLLTMVSLCDDLLRLTRSYLDYAAIVQGSRPLCLGSFTVGARLMKLIVSSPRSPRHDRSSGCPTRSPRRPWSSPMHHAVNKSSATSSRMP